MDGDLDLDGRKEGDSDDEPWEPGALFKIKKDPSQLETDFPDGVLFPDLEAAKERRAKRMGLGEQEEDDDDLYGESPHQFGSCMPGLRTGLAEMFRKAIKEAWAKIMLEAVVNTSADGQMMSTMGTGLPPKPADFVETRRWSKSDGDMTNLGSLPGSPSRAREAGRPLPLTEPGQEIEASTCDSPSMDRLRRQLGDDTQEQALLGSPKGSPVSSDAEETSRTLQRLRYARRLEARTSTVAAASRSRQKWRQCVKLCKRKLGTLDSVGAFAERQCNGPAWATATF